jgi:hypothetical protein
MLRSVSLWLGLVTTVAIGGLPIAGGGCASTRASETPEPEPVNLNCPATDYRFLEACIGCSPLDEAISNALGQTHLTDDVKTYTRQCLSGTADLNVAGKDIGKLALQECAERTHNLGDAYAKTLSRVVDDARTTVDPGAQKNWEACRNAVRQCGKKDCPPPPAQAADPLCDYDHFVFGGGTYNVTMATANGSVFAEPSVVRIVYAGRDTPRDMATHSPMDFQVTGPADVFLISKQGQVDGVKARCANAKRYSASAFFFGARPDTLPDDHKSLLMWVTSSEPPPGR